MNYYERIQQGIDYIEDNLEEALSLEAVAEQANMSLSNFYRLFFALAGHTVKEYTRQRRLSLAAWDLRQSSLRIIDVAVKYDFDSADAFARAFRKATGLLPSEYRMQTHRQYYFGKVNLMEKYYEENQDPALLAQFPDIKVLKEMKPMRVAYYNHFGYTPEEKAFEVIQEWLSKNNLEINERRMRIFGYNNPSPETLDQEYGYEVCVTLDDSIQVNDPKVKEKILGGGQYAVISAKPEEGQVLGEAIMMAWQRLNKWIESSKYTFGAHQWMEEHVGFDGMNNHIGGVDIYLPIVRKTADVIAKEIIDIAPFWTASYTATGKQAIKEARDYFFEWADKKGLFQEAHRFFAYYTFEKLGQEDFMYSIYVSVAERFQPGDENILVSLFPGGKYAVMASEYGRNAMAWQEFMKWGMEIPGYTIGDHKFMEEYLLEKPELDIDTKLKLYLPVAEI